MDKQCIGATSPLPLPPSLPPSLHLPLCFFRRAFPNRDDGKVGGVAVVFLEGLDLQERGKEEGREGGRV